LCGDGAPWHAGRAAPYDPVEEMRGRIGPMAVVVTDLMRRDAALKMHDNARLIDLPDCNERTSAVGWDQSAAGRPLVGLIDCLSHAGIEDINRLPVLVALEPALNRSGEQRVVRRCFGKQGERGAELGCVD